MHCERTMDLLDEMGMIVFDETRWFESTEESLEQLRVLVMRDRNRPSVVFWSTGNEEYYQKIKQGAEARSKFFDGQRMVRDVEEIFLDLMKK